MQAYLCLMVFMIPFVRISFNVLSHTVSVGGHSFKYVPYGLLLWSILLILKRRERPRFTRTPIDLPILAYLSFCILSIITSCDVKAGLEELIRIIAFLMWFYLIVNHVKEERQIKWMLIALLIGSIYLSVYGLHKYFVMGKWPSGVGGGYIRVGAYFAMTIPVILGQSLWSRSLWRRLSFAFGVLIMAVTMAFTFARGPWMALFGAMVFLGFLWDKRVLIILAAALVLFPLLVPDAGISRLKSLARVQVTEEARISDWKVAINMIADHPFSGVGLGDAYGTAYPEYHLGHSFRRCHNLYLSLAASIGIPGLAAYLWLLVVFFRKGLKTLRGGGKGEHTGRARHLFQTQGGSKGRIAAFFRREEANTNGALLASILAGVVAILIASLTDEHFHTSEISMTFWFLMGLGTILMTER